MAMQQGDKAPVFTANDQNGNPVDLADYKGRKVALYFYPKDNTETCTVEACNLRDNYGLLTGKGIAVLGISPDNEKSHKKFEQKYTLPFTLVADTDKTIAESYGVWAEKKFMGRTYMGVLRTTFLINEDGVIAHVIDKVTSKDHAAQIAEVWGI